MRAWVIKKHGDPSGLALVEHAEPKPGHGEVLVRVCAVSLNYRDSIMLKGGRPGTLPPPFIPCSDAAGEVIEIGTGVTKWKPGDRVANTFFRDWTSGSMTRDIMKLALGGAMPGVLAERVAFREGGLVRVPEHLSFSEAATLPCAAVTAWNALADVAAGETVLLLGTGGVSLFALQFAKLRGARVIITSSSDEKLARARALGADETINYRNTPEWSRHVFELTDRHGVDLVVEVGGAGTLPQSFDSLAFQGRISLIGVLTGGSGEVNPWPLIGKSATMRGIYVGHREMFEAMNRAISQHALRPVIDRAFPFDAAREAFVYQRSGAVFGKVVIET